MYFSVLLITILLTTYSVTSYVIPRDTNYKTNKQIQNTLSTKPYKKNFRSDYKLFDYLMNIVNNPGTRELAMANNLIPLKHIGDNNHMVANGKLDLNHRTSSAGHIETPTTIRPSAEIGFERYVTKPLTIDEGFSVGKFGEFKPVEKSTEHGSFGLFKGPKGRQSLDFGGIQIVDPHESNDDSFLGKYEVLKDGFGDDSHDKPLFHELSFAPRTHTFHHQGDVPRHLNEPTTGDMKLFNDGFGSFGKFLTKIPSTTHSTTKSKTNGNTGQWPDGIEIFGTPFPDSKVGLVEMGDKIIEG